MFFIRNGDAVYVDSKRGDNLGSTYRAVKTGKVLGILNRILNNFGPVPFYEIQLEHTPGVLLVREDVFLESYEVAI